MFSIRDLSDVQFDEFGSPIVVRREGRADRSEVAILHLDAETWDSAGGVEVLHRVDMMSVFHDVDIERGDRIVCADPDVVPQSTVFEVTARLPDNDDRWLKDWRLKRCKL